ncbi:LptF/LptG family permease [Devosia sp. CAU 1758]
MRAAFDPCGVAGRYQRQLMLASAWSTLVILGCVEWVFLSELLISHILPRVLEVNAGWAQMAQLVVYSVPDGVAVALPLALSIGVYIVLLRRREAGEFIAMAGIGVGYHALIRFSLLIGALGAIASVVVSGHIAPLASYAAATSYDHARFEALRRGNLPAGQFYPVDDLVVFAAEGRFGGEAGGVFVHQELEGERYRVITSPRVIRLELKTGTPQFLLEQARLLDFSTASDAVGLTRPSLRPQQILTASRHAVAVPELEPEQPGVRLDQIYYWSLSELLLRALDRFDALNAGIRHVLHAVLCALAPLFALAALGWTGRRSVVFALPVVAGGLLAATFFLRDLAELIGAMGALASGPAVLLSGTGLGVLACCMVARRGTQCIVPAGVRL